MSCFTHKDYFGFIREKLKENEQIRGYQAQMARAMGVHGSYLSRILKEEVQITPDQAALLGQFWALPPLDFEYFMAMVAYARAGSEYYRNHLSTQMQLLQKEQESLSRRFAEENTEVAAELYYSAWYFSAIHLLLMVPKFSAPHSIAQRLGLPKALVLDALAKLASIGLITKNGSGWKVVKNNLHLANASLWAPIHHAQWRQKAMLRLQEHDPEALAFSGVHAISNADFKRIKSLLLDAIEKTRKIAGPSSEEDLFYISVDAFRV